jgi:hypothetical protein
MIMTITAAEYHHSPPDVHEAVRAWTIDTFGPDYSDLWILSVTVGETPDVVLERLNTSNGTYETSIVQAPRPFPLREWLSRLHV